MAAAFIRFHNGQTQNVAKNTDAVKGSLSTPHGNPAGAGGTIGKTPGSGAGNAGSAVNGR